VSAWPTARLGDIARFQNGRAFKPSEWSPVGLPIIRIENLTDHSAQFNRFEGLVDERHLVRDGDLLVSWSASLDAFIWNRGLAVLNQHIFKVNEDERLLDRSYFFHVLRHAMTAIRGQVHGATMQHITKPAFEAVTIPLPPLDEQRRIAARLREQLAEVDLVAAAAQARIDQMNSLAQRAIDAAIPASNAIALGHALRAPMRTGLSRAASATANHRVLTLSSVRNGVLEVGKNRPMDATDDEALANAVRPSTFYVVRGNGSLHMAGAGALSPESSDGVVLYPDLLIQVDPDPALLSVDYLALAWRSRRVRHQVEARLRTSAGIHKINLANLSTVEVPLPSLADQRRIAARLSEQLAEIDRAKAALAAQRAAIGLLPPALLREVFGAEEDS